MYLKHKSDHHIFLSKTLWWLSLTFRVNLKLEGPSWLGLICHLLPLPAHTFSNTQLFLVPRLHKYFASGVPLVMLFLDWNTLPVS